MEQYIYPIFGENRTVIGQGFVANGLFITAAHILEKDAASIGIPYIYWKGEKLLLNETPHLFTSYNVDETKPESLFQVDLTYPKKT